MRLPIVGRVGIQKGAVGAASTAVPVAMLETVLGMPAIGTGGPAAGAGGPAAGGPALEAPVELILSMESRSELDQSAAELCSEISSNEKGDPSFLLVERDGVSRSEILRVYHSVGAVFYSV